MSKLLTEFPEHSYEQWHAAAEALLKGASFEQKLVTKTYEDIVVQPIYRREHIVDLAHRTHSPGSASRVRGSTRDGFLACGWEVSQELAAATAGDFNRLIHEGLNGGQSELNLVMPSHGCGWAEAAAALPVLLDGVNIDAVSIWWQTGGSSAALASRWLAYAEESGVATATLRGGLENDPLAEALPHGGLSESLAQRLDEMASLTESLSVQAPHLRTMCATGDVWHHAGASATQELAYVMATVVAYVEEMKTRGLAPALSMPRIRMRLAVGSDFFMEIAKIRAARWLWSRLAEAYGVACAPLHLHASTSRWNKTSYDPHTNLLRVTSEAFAAVVAGADSLHIGPYDEISGITDGFSRRIARNLHTILREECGLDRVIDPAGGSYYVEWLTDQVAARAWALFQDIEKQGGMVAALESGVVQQATAALCHQRLQNIRRRKDRLVGVNMYPDLHGRKLSMPAAARAAHGPQVFRIPALPRRRAAEEYEALRDACAAYAETAGAVPTLLQLNLGPSRRYRLRADWTAAFFEAAGFAVDGHRDFHHIDDAVAALAGSQATVAVITSDDATYAELAVPLAKAIKAARPATHLVLAGTPGEQEAVWRAAGIDDFVHVRSNNYDLNEQLLKKSGVL